MFHKRFTKPSHWQHREERRHHDERSECGERGEHGDPRERFFQHRHEHGRGGPSEARKRFFQERFGPHGRAWFGHGDDENAFWGRLRGGPFGRGPFGGDPSDEDGGGRRRQRRGDIKYVILELLAEQPRHGYDLIKEIEQRYGGFYRPSPGTIYPTLQLLEDEGNLVSETVDSKRVYTITDAGRKQLAESQQRREQEGRGRGHDRGFWGGNAKPELQALQQNVFSLIGGVMQAARHATPQQVEAITTLLDNTRREVYAILAKEEPKDSTTDL